MNRVEAARKLANSMCYGAISTTRRLLVISVGGKNALLGARLAELRDECDGTPKPQRLARIARELEKYKGAMPQSPLE
ncbi:MAG: hypothetical protein WC263_03370 [Candidatus Micrarchaeia archaeon]|jgi:hypothetical protein